MIYDAFGIWGIASYLASYLARHRVSFDLKTGLFQKKTKREGGGGGLRGHTFLKKPLEFLVFLL